MYIRHMDMDLLACPVNHIIFYWLLPIMNDFPGFITGYCMSEALILSTINQKYNILDEYSNLY